MPVGTASGGVARKSMATAVGGTFHDWTSYVAIVGKGTLWQEDHRTSSEELRAKPRRVLLAEKRETGIHWMQPEDILAGSANWGVSKLAPTSLAPLLVTAASASLTFHD